MVEKHKFICSTAYDWGKRKVGFTLAIIFLILVDVFAWANAGLVARLYGEGLVTVLIIGTLVGVGYYVWAIMNMISISRSYLHIYDDHIEGVTLIPLTGQTGSISFNLKYDQISHVETAKKQIIIYTSFAKYTVMAMNNQYRAQEEIRKRISSKN